MIPRQTPFSGDIAIINQGNLKEISPWIQTISKWKVKTLSFWGSKNAAVLKEITHIHFTTLTFLSLMDNYIESIEELPRVQMPYIRSLILSVNNITASIFGYSMTKWRI